MQKIILFTSFAFFFTKCKSLSLNYCLKYFYLLIFFSIKRPIVFLLLLKNSISNFSLAFLFYFLKDTNRNLAEKLQFYWTMKKKRKKATELYKPRRPIRNQRSCPFEKTSLLLLTKWLLNNGVNLKKTAWKEQYGMEHKK